MAPRAGSSTTSFLSGSVIVDALSRFTPSTKQVTLALALIGVLPHSHTR